MIDKFYQPIDEMIKVIHNINNSNVMEKQHFHNSYELHFTVSNNLKFIINDELFWAPKGSVFIINPFTPHMSVVSDGVWFERYTVHIKEEIIMKLNDFPKYDLFDLFNTGKRNNVNHIKLDNEGILFFKEMLKRLINYSINKYFGADVFQHLTLSEVLFFLLGMEKEGRFNREHSVNDENYILVKNIINLLDKKLQSDLKLDIISEKFYRSKSTINRIFRKYSGTTVSQYITSRRIYLACELLAENIPVFIVSEQSGFSDYNHFIRTFKRFIGATPKQYALQHLKSNPLISNNFITNN